MFLTAPIPSYPLNVFAMNERRERKETEMHLKIGLEKRREYKSVLKKRALENVLE